MKWLYLESCYIQLPKYKYLASIMDDSEIISYKIIEPYNEERKTSPTSFNEKKAACKTRNFTILYYFNFTD